MRLLFITQKIDSQDDLLGVYHEWVRALALRIEKISVICLKKGVADLPENVSVFSLGKESGRSRLKYILNFYRYIWRLRKDYDVVFVHMNPEYVILGGLLWKILRKRIMFWCAHYLYTPRIWLAEKFADKIITSVRQAYPRPIRKVVAVGQGIAIERFRLPRKDYSGPPRLLFLGRISPVKDLETLIRAAKIIADKGTAFRLDIVGGPTERDRAYLESMRRLVRDLKLEECVSFLGRVPNAETPRVYAAHDIFVNLTRTGSFDKSTLEAMAAGLPVLVANRAFTDIFPENLKKALIFDEKNAADLALKIQLLMNRSPAEILSIGKELSDIVARHHSLDGLSEKLVAEFSAS